MEVKVNIKSDKEMPGLALELIDVIRNNENNIQSSIYEQSQSNFKFKEENTFKSDGWYMSKKSSIFKQLLIWMGF